MWRGLKGLSLSNPVGFHDGVDPGKSSEWGPSLSLGTEYRSPFSPSKTYSYSTCFRWLYCIAKRNASYEHKSRALDNLKRSC